MGIWIIFNFHYLILNVAEFSLPKFDKIFISRSNKVYYIISSWLKKTTISFRISFGGEFHHLLSFGVVHASCLFYSFDIKKKSCWQLMLYLFHDNHKQCEGKHIHHQTQVDNLTHICIHIYHFLFYFNLSSWLWVYQLEVDNIFWNKQENWTYPKNKMLENNALNLLLLDVIYFSFLTCFEWSKILWVHQFELYNPLLTPSVIELCLNIFSSKAYFVKPKIYHTKLNIIFKPHISFFVHFEQSLPWWVHQVKVHNISLKSKDN
jgi:hypothetical protein